MEDSGLLLLMFSTDTTPLDPEHTKDPWQWPVTVACMTLQWTSWHLLKGLVALLLGLHRTHGSRKFQGKQGTRLSDWSDPWAFLPLPFSSAQGCLWPEKCLLQSSQFRARDYQNQLTHWAMLPIWALYLVRKIQLLWIRVLLSNLMQRQTKNRIADYIYDERSLENLFRFRNLGLNWSQMMLGQARKKKGTWVVHFPC